MSKLLDKINDNKYFAGIAMLILNIGTKYITIELSDTQDDFLKNVIIRRLGLFTIFWFGTKDILVSLILTGIFVIFVSNMFNENSKYCILKKKNKQRTITAEDYEKYKILIKKYEQKHKSNN